MGQSGRHERPYRDKAPQKWTREPRAKCWLNEATLPRRDDLVVNLPQHLRCAYCKRPGTAKLYER